MKIKNVYELIQERLEVIFKEFDNIYIFQVEKDSGVLLNLCLTLYAVGTGLEAQDWSVPHGL